MRENIRNKVKENIYFVLLFASIFLLTIILILTNDIIYKTLGIKFYYYVSVIFDLSKIILFVLLVSISIRVIRTSNSLRIVVYTIIFALGASFSFVAFLKYYFPVNNIVEYSYLYYFLSVVIIALGIFLGANIPIRQKYILKNPVIIKTVIYGLFLIIVFYFSLTEIEGLLSIDYLYISHYISAIILIGALIVHVRNYLRIQDKIELHFIFGILLFILSNTLYLIYFNISKHILLLYSFYEMMGTFILFQSIYSFNIIDYVNRIRNDQKELKQHTESLQNIINKKDDELKESSQEILNEIEYAKILQQSLLPDSEIKYEGARFISEYIPCESLSGDFYDIFEIDRDTIGMYVLDVSGHGVSAAFMTMACNNIIKSEGNVLTKYRASTPHMSLKYFYDEFNNMNFPSNMHMVIFFASYNKKSKVLKYSSGGINCYPYLVKQNGKSMYLDKSKGFPICNMKEIIIPEYTTETIVLEKGDRIIFYTDGLIDTFKNNTLSEEELESIMKDYRYNSLNALNAEIKSYINLSSDNKDDITYFIMQID